MTSATEWVADQTRHNRPLQWIVGGDTGTSSVAIWAHMMGLERPRWGWSHPGDAGDLGRCIRLLQLMPEWADRMPEMADRSKQWAALIAGWDQLLVAYEEWGSAMKAQEPKRICDAAARMHHLMLSILHPSEARQGAAR